MHLVSKHSRTYIHRFVEYFLAKVFIDSLRTELFIELGSLRPVIYLYYFKLAIRYMKKSLVFHLSVTLNFLIQ